MPTTICEIIAPAVQMTERWNDSQNSGSDRTVA